jgi:heme/copper-type cytochrome/quinol oxidase subunit 2
MTDIQLYMTIWWVIGAIIVLVCLLLHWDEIFADEDFAREHDLSGRQMLALNIAVFVIMAVMWPVVLATEAQDIMGRRKGGK